ncbi:MAG: CCA tRNA nucleotidyltransferase [Candidatus Diapherotrites archaeon]
MPDPSKLFPKVLARIKPSEKEFQHEMQVAEKFMDKIRAMEGSHVRVVLAGSLARNTHLKEDRDLDIFVLFPKHLSRDQFEREGLKLGKALFRGHEWELAYSEHPYVRGNIEGFEAEVVPSYEVEHASELQSAVDRSPFHLKYLLEKLSEKQRDEIRLLKQFLKGIEAYGADVKVQGLPGYACELLIVEYGSFWNAVRYMSRWKEGTIVDVERQLLRENARERFPNSSLIIVDPTDAGRNVAAALSKEQFARMISASKIFVQKPSIHFFFGKKQTPLKWGKAKNAMQKENILLFHFPYPKNALPDIAWGQMHRLARKLRNALEKADFSVQRLEAWTDEKHNAFFIVELEETELEKSRKRVGPLASNQEASENFLKAHLHPLNGPRIENGKWVLEEPRADWNAKEFVLKQFKEWTKVESAALKKALQNSSALFEKELKKFYAKDKKFREFFSGFLKGKEKFLEY